METWRWLLTPSLPGPANMAIDYAVARLAASGQAPPTVRFYSWKPYCLSLGYHQSLERVNFARCRELGIDVARRPTGGRAVYHAEEWTYSVIFSAESGVYRSSILETYLQISRWLVAGLRRIGVPAELAPVKRSRNVSHTLQGQACFSVPSSYEIVVAGRKLVGSAQRRWPGAVLQHGSILVGPEHLRIAELFCARRDGVLRVRTRLEKRTAWLRQFLPRPPALEEFSARMAQLWCELFGVRAEPGSLSGEETRLAQNLIPEFDLQSPVAGERANSACGGEA